MRFYVFQDGADFYLNSDPEGEKLVRVETAPFAVPDMDMVKAREARDWFNEYGYFKGADEVVFI
jgi:hypothetical protein